MADAVDRLVRHSTVITAGLAMRLFGATVPGARTLSTLAGTPAVLATFLLARALAGERVGWVAATLVACGTGLLSQQGVIARA